MLPYTSLTLGRATLINLLPLPLLLPQVISREPSSLRHPHQMSTQSSYQLRLLHLQSLSQPTTITTSLFTELTLALRLLHL
ncbi:hypothetical protein BKA59DRAFT_483985 [Fusarium tricinctum]|uniref:Uncharacterized protein n=1 Tax=Fusarium tricinctum TaxID=61284 RepID=A0A8K0RRW0_9HYPO|nr:hypothetical protein BKA59DRAFT_483985 [Fusarium tricinctum]